MSGIFITTANDASLDEAISYMDRVTREWEMRAARGECGWICGDCCVSFPNGMPDACEHGHQSCTDIIQRDKRDAAALAGTGGASHG
jgi:hypothetical protein